MSEKVRVDKWLWSVRIFKSRTLATKMVKTGKVKVNGATPKPSGTVEVDDILDVRKNHINYKFKVVKLIKKRVGAPIAVNCYEDLTPEAELRKFDDWFNGVPIPEKRERGMGRPTKKERRELDRFKGSEF